jgi:hypothetical protein
MEPWGSPSKRRLDHDADEYSDSKRTRVDPYGGSEDSDGRKQASSRQGGGNDHHSTGSEAANHSSTQHRHPGSANGARNASSDGKKYSAYVLNPFSLPDGLKPGVKARLEMIFASGKVQRDELDEKILGSLAELSEAQGSEIVDHFAEANMGSIRNKSAFLAGVLRRCGTKQSVSTVSEKLDKS